eukprot:maker-scaffold_8-snap-gene-8.70-mRNA-1 protein AED:0.69 eAED:0.69 QI:0/0/0/1/0/0/2/0/813
MKVVEKEDAENMALALIEFLGNFQFENNFTLVTDNASYFAGKLLQTLSEVYHFKRYFSIKFSPWTNGVVEVTNAKIVRIIRTLCSQFRLNVTEVHKLVGTIMDSLNNYPSRSKANFTPNQLFMNAPPTSSNTLLENISGLASALSNKLTKRNRTSIESNFHEVRKLMHERLTVAYNTTMEIRLRRNKRYNDKLRGPVIQYSPGDWILLSKSGTKASQVRHLPLFVGPYRIIKIISSNVYQIEDLLGKRQISHAARLWPYEDNTFEPTQEIVDLFLANQPPLEVEYFSKLSITDKKEVIVLTKWLGYDEPTWEPWRTMCEDLPSLSEDFILEYRGKHKKSAKQMWEDINSKPDARVGHIGVSVQAVPTSSPGWLPEEKEVLRCAAMKYGFGNHMKIRELNLLPGKNPQQLHNQLQKLVFKQAVSEYHGLFVDVYKIGRMNRDVFDTFYIRQHNITSEELILRRSLNQWRFGLTPMERHKVVIPFFRRLDNIESYIDYFTFNKYCNPGDIIPVLNEPQLERKILEKELVALINERKVKSNFFKFAQKHEYDIVEALKDFYANNLSIWSTSEDYVLLDLDGEQFRTSGRGSNHFVISTDSDLFTPFTSLDVIIPPPQSVQIKLDLSEPSAISLLLDSFGTFDLLHIDPPWNYLSDAPTRGASVSYNTLSDQDILSIHIGQLIKHGVVLLWTVNAKMELSKRWLQEQGFKFRNLITWVKTTKNDKLAVGNGHIFRHATEKCILATKGNHPDLLLGRPNDVILSNQKPVEIYELAETLLPGKQYLDLFSRSCNLRYRWFSVGLELITNYRKFIYEKEE